MGEEPAQTVEEIEDTRARLGRDIDELQDRLPPRGAVKKASIAALGGTGAVTAWVLLRRRKKREERAQTTTVVQLVPEPWASRMSSALEDREWKPWVIGGAGIWILLRLAEMRQVRRLNRLSAVRAAAA